MGSSEEGLGNARRMAHSGGHTASAGAGLWGWGGLVCGAGGPEPRDGSRLVPTINMQATTSHEIS